MDKFGSYSKCSIGLFPRSRIAGDFTVILQTDALTKVADNGTETEATLEHIPTKMVCGYLFMACLIRSSIQHC